MADYFDPHIRIEDRSDDDLAHLAYFDVSGAVICAHAPRLFDAGRDLVAYWKALVEVEQPRLARAGIRAHLALGMPPRALPRRAAPEVWRQLQKLSTHDAVLARGEVAVHEDRPDEWRLFERQVRGAQEQGLVLVVTPPRKLRINMTYKMMQRLHHWDIAPASVMFVGVEPELVRGVIAEGFYAGVVVGPFGVEAKPLAAALMELVREEGDTARELVAISGGVRSGAADMLGMAKLDARLEELGCTPEVRARWLRENARRFFRLSGEDDTDYR